MVYYMWWTGPAVNPRPCGSSWEAWCLCSQPHQTPPFFSTQHRPSSRPQHPNLLQHSHPRPLWLFLLGCFQLLSNSLIMCGPRYSTPLNQPSIWSARHSPFLNIRHQLEKRELSHLPIHPQKSERGPYHLS